MPPQSQANPAGLGTNYSIDPCNQSAKFDPSDQFLADTCSFSPQEIKRSSVGILYKPERSNQTEKYLVLNQKLATITLPIRRRETKEKFAIGNPNQSGSIKKLESLNDIPLREIQQELRNLGLLNQSSSLQEAMVRDNDYVFAHRTSHRKIAEPLNYFVGIDSKISERAVVNYNNIYFAVDKLEGPLQSSPLLDGTGSSTTFLLTNLTNGDQLKFSGLHSSLISKWGIYGDLHPQKVIEFFSPASNRNKKPLVQDFKVTKTSEELLGLFVADSWGLPAVSDGKRVQFAPTTLNEYLDAFTLSVHKGQVPKLYEVLKAVDLDGLFSRISDKPISFDSLKRILNLKGDELPSTLVPSILSRVKSVIVNEEGLGDFIFEEYAKKELIYNHKINFVLDASARKALVELVAQEVKESLIDYRQSSLAKPPINPLILNEVEKDPSILADVNKTLETIFSSLGVTPAKLDSTQFGPTLLSARHKSLSVQFFRKCLERENISSEISDLEIVKIANTLTQANYEKIRGNSSPEIPAEVLELLPKLKLTKEKLLETIDFCGKNYPNSETNWRIRHLFFGNIIETADELKWLYSDDQNRGIKIPNNNMLRFEPSSISELVDAVTMSNAEEYGSLHRAFLSQVNVDKVIDNSSKKSLSFGNLLFLKSYQKEPEHDNAVDLILGKVKTIEVEPDEVPYFKAYLESSDYKTIFSPDLTFNFSNDTRRELADLYVRSISEGFQIWADFDLEELKKLQVQVPLISKELNEEFAELFKALNVPQVGVESSNFVEAFVELRELRNGIDYLRTKYIFKGPESVSDLDLKNVLTAFRKDTAENVLKSGISTLDRDLLSSLAKADITPDKYLAAIEYTESFSYYQNSIARIAQLYNGEVEHYITTKSSKELVKKLLPPNLQEQVSDTFSILQLDSSTFFNPELLKRLQSTLLTQKPKTTRELNEILVGLLRPGLIPLIKSQYVSDVMVVPNEDKSIGNAQKKLVIKLNAEAIKNITPTNETFTETIYYGDLLYIIEPVFVTQPKQLMAQKLTLGDQFNYLTKDSLIFDKSNMFFSIPREPEDGEYLLIRKFDYR